MFKLCSTLFALFAIGDGTKLNWYYYHEYEYAIVYESLDWDAAQQYCHSQGTAWLVDIRSANEQQFIESVILSKEGLPKNSDAHSERFWIGAKRVTEDGRPSQFCWVNYHTVFVDYHVYQNWMRGEPNFRRNDEACASLVNGHSQFGKWNDDHCSLKKFRSICKRRVDDGEPTTINTAGSAGVRKLLTPTPPDTPSPPPPTNSNIWIVTTTLMFAALVLFTALGVFLCKRQTGVSHPPQLPLPPLPQVIFTSSQQENEYSECHSNRKSLYSSSNSICQEPRVFIKY